MDGSITGLCDDTALTRPRDRGPLAKIEGVEHRQDGKICHRSSILVRDADSGLSGKSFVYEGHRDDLHTSAEGAAG